MNNSITNNNGSEEKHIHFNEDKIEECTLESNTQHNDNHIIKNISNLDNNTQMAYLSLKLKSVKYLIFN